MWTGSRIFHYNLLQENIWFPVEITTYIKMKWLRKKIFLFSIYLEEWSPTPTKGLSKWCSSKWHSNLTSRNFVSKLYTSSKAGWRKFHWKFVVKHRPLMGIWALYIEDGYKGFKRQNKSTIMCPMTQWKAIVIIYQVYILLSKVTSQNGGRKTFWN